MLMASPSVWSSPSPCQNAGGLIHAGRIAFVFSTRRRFPMTDPTDILTDHNPCDDVAFAELGDTRRMVCNVEG